MVPARTSSLRPVHRLLSASQYTCHVPFAFRWKLEKAHHGQGQVEKRQGQRGHAEEWWHMVWEEDMEEGKGSSVLSICRDLRLL